MKTIAISFKVLLSTLFVSIAFTNCTKEKEIKKIVAVSKTPEEVVYRVTMKGKEKIVEKFTLSEATSKFSNPISRIALDANTGYYNSKGKVNSDFKWESLFDPYVPETWYLTVFSQCEIKQTSQHITGWMKWNPDTNARYNGSANFEPTGIYIKTAGSGLKAVIETKITENKGFFVPEWWENYYFYYVLYDSKSSEPDEYLWSYWLTLSPLDFLADPDGDSWNGAEWFPITSGYIDIKN
jgi:hypothetical protein